MKASRLPWRWVSNILIVAGLGWVGYLLVTTVDDPKQFIPDSIAWLIVATGLVALSLAANIWLFNLFLHTELGRCYPLGLVARLSVAGQLLRYLPGRIWGVAYQISAARERIPAIQLARANADLMVFSLFGSAIVAFLLLGYQSGWHWVTLVTLSTTGIVFLGSFFLGGANWLLRLFASLLPDKARRILEKLATGQLSISQMVLIFLIFISSWIIYLIGWNLLGLVFSNFSEVNFTALCAFYTLASIIGIVSAITPAGLGVREAAFVMLATGSMSPEVVAFFAVFGRIWLISVEIFLLIFIVSLLPNIKEAN